MPNFAIRGLDHLVLRVRDQDSMTRFYCELLGCRVERHLAEIGLIQLRAGDSLIDLVPAGDKAQPDSGAGNMDHFCLRIDPFNADELLRQFREQGVRLVGEVSRRYGAEGYGPSIYLLDPEGNTVELRGRAERSAMSGDATQ